MGGYRKTGAFLGVCLCIRAFDREREERLILLLRHQLGGNASETGGHRVDLDLLYRTALGHVCHIVGSQQTDAICLQL